MGWLASLLCGAKLGGNGNTANAGDTGAVHSTPVAKWNEANQATGHNDASAPQAELLDHAAVVDVHTAKSYVKHLDKYGSGVAVEGNAGADKTTEASGKRMLPCPPLAAQPAGLGAKLWGSTQRESCLVALQQRYVELLMPLAYRADVPLLEAAEEQHYFKKTAESAKPLGGQQMKMWLKRLTNEHATLAQSLPVAWNSSIFVAADSNRLDVLRALILGPMSGTPYANGAFIFDIYVPPEYPATPPKARFLTTAGGKVRFNPNLYSSGYICLSLLGTWGNSWRHACTLLQVLVSLQGIVFVADPYHNEPAYETKTASNRAACRAYNEVQQANTMQYAILPALTSPCHSFASIIRTHFYLKRDVIREQCATWESECLDTKVKARMQKVKREINIALNNLPAPSNVVHVTAVPNGS